MSVFVCLVIVELNLPHANSLKEKRSVIVRLLTRARNDLRVSAAEVGFQNRVRSATVAAAIVGSSRGQVEATAARFIRKCEADPRVEVYDSNIEWF